MSLKQTKLSIGCESSLTGFVDYGCFPNYGLLGNNESTFLLTMCNINWACSLNIRYVAHDKSQERDNFKWKLWFSNYHTCGKTNIPTWWVNLPGRPWCTQNSQQLHWVCKVPLGASWMCEKLLKCLNFLHYTLQNLFCKIHFYINSVSSVAHTVPACHRPDHQVTDHHRTGPRSRLNSYSRTSRTCWHTRLRFRTRSGRTHLHPRHICKGIDKYIAMHGSGEVDLYQSEREE